MTRYNWVGFPPLYQRTNQGELNIQVEAQISSDRRPEIEKSTFVYFSRMGGPCCFSDFVWWKRASKLYLFLFFGGGGTLLFYSVPCVPLS